MENKFAPMKIDRKLHDMLKAHKAKTGISLKAILEMAIKEFIQNHKE